MSLKDIPVGEFNKTDAYRERMQFLCEAAISVAFVGDKLKNEEKSEAELFDQLEEKLGNLSYHMELCLSNGDLSAGNIAMAQMKRSSEVSGLMKSQSLVVLDKIAKGMRKFFMEMYDSVAK